MPSRPLHRQGAEPKDCLRLSGTRNLPAGRLPTQRGKDRNPHGVTAAFHKLQRCTTGVRSQWPPGTPAGVAGGLDCWEAPSGGLGRGDSFQGFRKQPRMLPGQPQEGAREAQLTVAEACISPPPPSLAKELF